jgi:DNA repair exonuclease SbcCD ATPase subunit
MTKKNHSKRKRQVIMSARINIEEAGIVVPEHIKKMKNPRKLFRLEEYSSNLDSLKINLNNLIQILENARNAKPPIDPEIYNRILSFNLRSSVIQYFVILDEMINSVLTQHQRELNITNDKIEYYERVDIGINKFLTQENRSKDFEQNYSYIKHFRTLRNQFAHYKEGVFCLVANQESFESFVNKLEGIDFLTKGGYHCYVDGNPGMMIPYTTVSGEYVHSLFDEGTNFYTALLDAFFPDPKE